MCYHVVWQLVTSVLRNQLPPFSRSYREAACSSETLQISYRPHSIISQIAAMNTELTQNEILKSGKNQIPCARMCTETRSGHFEHLMCIQQ
jgi:hypothetical protein